MCLHLTLCVQGLSLSLFIVILFSYACHKSSFISFLLFPNVGFLFLFLTFLASANLFGATNHARNYLIKYISNQAHSISPKEIKHQPDDGQLTLKIKIKLWGKEKE